MCFLFWSATITKLSVYSVTYSHADNLETALPSAEQLSRASKLNAISPSLEKVNQHKYVITQNSRLNLSHSTYIYIFKKTFFQSESIVSIKRFKEIIKQIVHWHYLIQHDGIAGQWLFYFIIVPQLRLRFFKTNLIFFEKKKKHYITSVFYYIKFICVTILVY